jgi:methyl-accepting chemotaxis protein
MSPLGEIEDKLQSLSRSTEDELLAIGESLLGFHRRAGEISEMASSMGVFLSGERIHGAMEELRSIFERMEQVKGESERNIRTLMEIMEALGHLKNHLDGFTKIVRMLNVLCNSTRIENARLAGHDVGFEALADDVRKLASMVEAKCGELSDRSELLGAVIRQTLSRLSAIMSVQHSQARLVQENARESLESLTERYEQSSVAAGNISRKYGDISGNIAEIVTSMQFHDITRQRIEHVTQAVGSLRREHTPNKGGSMMEGNGWRRMLTPGQKVPAVAGDVCNLQAAQLQQAGGELVSAVNRISRSLSGIAAGILEISEEARGMVGVDGKADQYFFTDIEASVASAASALSEYGDASEEMRSAVVSVSATLGDMSTYAGEIEGIGTKMKLIALNAIVRASHIGEEGAALSVLSEHIHQLSIDTCHMTGGVCETLRSIIGSADALAFNARTDEDSLDGEIRRTEEALGRLSVTFREVNENIASLLGRIDEEGRGLSSDIAKTVSEVAVHEKVSNVINEALSRLYDVAAASEASRTGSQSGDVSRYPRSIETSYTMEGEREIHKSLLKTDATKGASPLTALVLPSPGTPGAPDSPDASEASNAGSHSGLEPEDEDLGDNVELF